MSVQGLGQPQVPQFSSNQASNATNNSALMQKCLKSPVFKTIVSSFGIAEAQIVNIQQQNGMMANMMAAFKDVQLIQLDAMKNNTLKAMGIEGAELAMVLQSEEEIKSIKRRMKEIKGSTYNKKMIQALLKALGVPINTDSLVFTDESGGLYIIQSQFEKIQQGLDLLEDN